MAKVMRTQSSRKVLVLLSTLVFLLTGQIAAQGYVWCIGQDGHSLLEVVEGQSCGSPGGEEAADCHEALSSEMQSPEDHCGPCLDLPPSHQAASTRLRDLPQTSLHLPAIPPAPVRIEPPRVEVIASPLHHRTPPPRYQSLHALRTVVLLN